VSGCGSEQGISAATSLATMQQCNNGQTNNARCEKCGTLRMFNKQTNSLTNVRNCNGNNSAVNNVLNKGKTKIEIGQLWRAV